MIPPSCAFLHPSPASWATAGWVEKKRVSTRRTAGRRPSQDRHRLLREACSRAQATANATSLSCSAKSLPYLPLAPSASAPLSARLLLRTHVYGRDCAVAPVSWLSRLGISSLVGKAQRLSLLPVGIEAQSEPSGCGTSRCGFVLHGVCLLSML